MTAPRYRKIEGHWYVLKSHMADQMQRVIIQAQLDVLAELSNRTRPQPLHPVVKQPHALVVT